MPDETKQNIYSKIGTILAYTTAGLSDPSAILKMQAEANAAQQKMADEQRNQDFQNLIISRLVGGDGFGQSPNIQAPSVGVVSNQKMAQNIPQTINPPMSLITPPKQFEVTQTKIGDTTIKNVGQEIQQKNIEDQNKINLDIANEYGKQKAKSDAELQVLVPKIQSILEDVNIAYDEIAQKNPDAMKPGFSGWVARKDLEIGSSEFFDEYPQVAALVDNLKADATAFAKSSGEQRPTDEDIRRFLATLLDPTRRSLPTNIAKAESMQRRLSRQGINTDWMAPLITQMKSRNMANGLSLKIDGANVTIREK